jgi:hypothetical protein
MRKEKDVIRLARGLIDLVADEAARNSAFSEKLEALFEGLGDKRAKKVAPASPKEPSDLPDIYAEWRARGEAEFRLWLREQPIDVLRMVIREHELDPSRRAEKWREAEKLSGYIADQLQARLRRGSGFQSAVRPHQGVTLAIAKDGNKFDACIMLSHVGHRGNELSQLFHGTVAFADALRQAQEFSEQKGFGGLYEIQDETAQNGAETFSTLEDWQNAQKEIDRQLGPLKGQSGLNWASDQVITPRDLARSLPFGPQIERLMLLRASVFKRRPVLI